MEQSVIDQSIMEISQRVFMEMQPKFTEMVKKKLEAAQNPRPKRDNIIYKSTVNSLITFTEDEVMSKNFNYPHPLIRMTRDQDYEFITAFTFSLQDIKEPKPFHSRFLEFIKVVEKNGLGRQAEKVLGYFKRQREVKERNALKNFLIDDKIPQTEPNPLPEPKSDLSSEVVGKPDRPKPKKLSTKSPAFIPSWERPLTAPIPGGNDPMPVPKRAESLLDKVEAVISICNLDRNLMYGYVYSYVQENQHLPID